MLSDVSLLTGKTPLIDIRYLYNSHPRHLYAKLENYNSTGSIKDRVAYYIVSKAFRNGTLKPGMTIAEATSGNTGISFAAIAACCGLKCIIFMPNWMSSERINLLNLYGAEIRLVSKEEGGFLECIRRCEELAKERDDIFLPRQFSNLDNVNAHYETTGAEIASTLSAHGLTADCFACGVGTGGTIMGAGSFLKSVNPNTKLHPIEPLSSPTLRTGKKHGHHRIEGIADEFIPDLLKLNQLDSIIDIADSDAIIMAQMLSYRLGLGVGISSGANFLGAVAASNLVGRKCTAVTVFVDDNKKYLSTDLIKPQEMHHDFISSRITLVDYSVM